jgi:hypothetical protein
MTVSFPIAADAEGALKAPVGRAARQREAREAAGEAVSFVRELTGPAFASREAAEAAYAGHLDGPGATIAPEDRYCELMEVASPEIRRRRLGGQAEPTCEDGRRWPKPPEPLPTVWRLSVSYWRTCQPEPAEADLPQARAARRREGGGALEPSALRRMAAQALQPVKPQQPLDIGLFERRLPEAPDVIVPDE